MNYKNIKMLILDCDGVLTDGAVYYSSQGEEMRRFDIKDGYGISKMLESGVIIAIISKSKSTPILYRAEQLGIKEVHIGVSDKVKRAKELFDKYNLTEDDVSFVGDDIPDLKLMKLVKYPMTVADASEENKRAAVFVTESRGGHGAIREIAELILKSE
jgi:3-deoxy-D-manno-octulosonate 8-phosphate phosphatase (KDO 8-P phosphatase)